MKIAVYANEITRQGESGVKTYSLEIINHLLQTDDKNEYILYCKKDIKDKVVVQKAKMVVAGRKKHLWAFTVFAKLVKAERPDVVFMPVQTFPFLIRPKGKLKIVITVHDVAFLFFPQHFTFIRRQILRFHTKRAVKFADRVIVPSEATKNDLVRVYGVSPEKIRVVYHGVSGELLKMADKNDPRVIGLSGKSPYILYVGSVQPRKNIIRLVRAFDMLKATGKFNEYKLIICGGKGWLYEKIYQQMGCSPYSEDIILVGDASNNLLASLYAGATLFVMPSLYEGFGLPVVEAMSFGLPVICADNSSLAEIADGAALLVDAYSPEDIFRKVERILEDGNLRFELSRKGLARAKDFNWEKTAEETLEVIESVR